MHVVAIEQPPGALADCSRELADATGLSLYEVRARLRALSESPTVVASFADPKEARVLLQRLHDAGFRARLVPGDVEERRGRVVSYGLSPRTMTVQTSDGRSLEFAPDRVTMLLHGARLRLRDEVRLEVKHTSGLPGMLGLRVAPASPTVTRTTHDHFDAFVHAYLPDGMAVVFDETQVRYAASEVPLHPTRAANFAQLVATLRARCAGARYDNRLLTRAGQAKILGSALRPELHLDVAIALLAPGNGPRSPYR